MKFIFTFRFVIVAAILGPVLPSLHAGLGLVDPVVNSTSDTGGPGTLREAVNGSQPGSTITFAPGLSGQTIRLTNGELTIAQNLTIDASALAKGITISGNDDSRVFHINGAHTVELVSLTITRGKTADGIDGVNGGAADNGGGIFNNGGTLTILNATIAGNTTGNGSDGDVGGSAGSGGAIYTNGGTVTVRNSTISGNSTGNGGDGSIVGGGAGGPGGGIFNNGGTLTIQNSTIANNVAGDGGVEPGNDFAGFGGSGGGIYNDAPGTLTVENSTITGNTTGDSPRVGGGSGSGGGIFNNMTASVTLTNSIVAENLKGVGGQSPDIFNNHGTGTVNRSGKNLIGDNDQIGNEFPVGDPNVNGDLVGNSLNPFGPELGPLTDNGGPTKTRVPEIGSPVIDISQLLPDLTVGFTAELSTITGTPFGLNSGDHLNAVVSGAFGYDLDIADTNAADTQRGNYPQTNGLFRVDLPNGSEINGSTTPFIQVEDFLPAISDTFRFIDGPRGAGPQGGAMSVDGAPDNDVELSFSLSDGAGTTFSDDSLPDPFPFLTGSIPGHTFSLKDAGGTALLQFLTIEEGTSSDLTGDQRGQPRVSGVALDLGAVERLAEQPDLRIGKKSNPDTHKINDTYTSSGAGQKPKVKLKGKRKMKFHTSIENDGDLDTILLKLTPRRFKPGLIVKTFRLTGGRQNVSSALKGPGFAMPDLAKGETVVFQTQVKNKSGGRLRQSLKFTASSQIDRAKIDVGKPKVIGK